MLEKFKTRYHFTNDGDVLSLLSTGRYSKLLEEPRLMKSQIDVHGYVRYTLLDDTKKQHTVFKHSIVLYVNNVVPTKEQTQINHKNGIKVDNRLDNLEWCTSSENQIHKYTTLGCKSTKRVFTDDQVKAIRNDYKENTRGSGITSLARKYEVSYSTMRDIVQNTTYKELT